MLPVIVVGGYTYNLPEAKKNPDLAKRTFSALKMGVIKAREKPHEAKAALHKYITVPGAVIDRLPDAYVILASEIDPTLIDQTLDLYVLSGIIPRKIDLSSLLDYAKNIR